MAQSSRSAEMIYQGVAASPGVAIGPVHVVARGFSAPEVYAISAERVDDERTRFGRALEITKRQLTDLQDRIKGLSGEEEGRIFEAHLMILEDRTVLDRVFEAIEDRLQNAEFAFYAVMQNFLEAMRRINDPYLRDRTADVEDICQRVLRNFREIRTSEPHGETTPGHQHILVAYDLSPSDTAAMNRSSVLGFATEIGSVNSHTAILARSLGLPAVVGLQDVVFDIETLSQAILDGYSGRIIINPTSATLEFYRKLEQEKREARTALESQRGAVSETTDNRLITLSANIEFVHELPWVTQSGAKGIGLFRTEFLLLDGEDVADETKQTEVYTEIAKSVAPHPVIIRTLDAGGDKLPAEPLSEPEPNPFLGWRGIRVSLARTAHGKAAIMFPLISGLGEVLEAKRLLAECMDELTAKGIAFDPEIEVGVMIEVPSAAILADLIAPHVDFMSIGTNDLIQYTVAVDRVNHHVANLYRPTNPAVVRLIRKTVEAADANGIWTGVCGEMAGDLRFTPLLIGLGVCELSVGTHQVPQVRQAIRSLNHTECQEMVAAAMRCSRSSEILDLTCGLARLRYGALLD
jgi:phosphotransferase system enzyme I (PtsI)